jgi:hypothetical protein
LRRYNLVNGPNEVNALNDKFSLHASREELRNGQGLTLVHFSAQLEDLRDTSLTLALNLSTSTTHPRINLGNVGDKGS